MPELLQIKQLYKMQALLTRNETSVFPIRLFPKHCSLCFDIRNGKISFKNRHSTEQLLRNWGRVEHDTVIANVSSSLDAEEDGSGTI
jgi:hypothetical protein